MEFTEIFDIDDFFEIYWTKKFFYLKGENSRYADVFNYESLNHILNFHYNCIDSRILRVVKNGYAIDKNNYFDSISKKKYGNYYQLNIRKLKDLLNNGYTIVLDEIHLMNESVSKMANKIAQTFKAEDISVNAYFSKLSESGFDLHYDTHDVFIFQIEGRKEWELAGITYKNPLPEQNSNEKRKPKSPRDKVILDKGDMLYIPRGMWHKATACDEGSLHLTFGVKGKTFIDVILDLANILKQDEFMRKNILESVERTEPNIFIEKLLKIILEEKDKYLDKKYFKK